MPNSELIVMCVVGAFGLWAVCIVLHVIWLACITRKHFDPKTFYEKYDRATVESMSERGGW